MSATAVSYPVNYIECGFCHVPLAKGILKNGIRFCSGYCFSLYDMASLKTVFVKICCICNNRFHILEFEKISKGIICSKVCFHHWLDDGLAKYKAHVAAKQIFQAKK